MMTPTITASDRARIAATLATLDDAIAKVQMPADTETFRARYLAAGEANVAAHQLQRELFFAVVEASRKDHRSGLQWLLDNAITVDDNGASS